MEQPSADLDDKNPFKPYKALKIIALVLLAIKGAELYDAAKLFLQDRQRFALIQSTVILDILVVVFLSVWLFCMVRKVRLAVHLTTAAVALPLVTTAAGALSYAVRIFSQNKEGQLNAPSVMIFAVISSSVLCWIYFQFAWKWWIARRHDILKAHQEGT